MPGITGGGLIQLGYEPEVDFELYDEGSGVYIKEWKSPDPQPSVAEIEAAEILYQQSIETMALARETAIYKVVSALGLTPDEQSALGLLNE